MARRRFRPDQNNANRIKNAAASRDKYLNMAREAMSQGDRIEAENYLQHADHYFRVFSSLQEEDARNHPDRYENSERFETAERTEQPIATWQVEQEENSSQEHAFQSEQASSSPSPEGHAEAPQRHHRYKGRRREIHGGERRPGRPPRDETTQQIMHNEPAKNEESASEEAMPYAAA